MGGDLPQTQRHLIGVDRRLGLPVTAQIKAFFMHRKQGESHVNPPTNTSLSVICFYNTIQTSFLGWAII